MKPTNCKTIGSVLLINAGVIKAEHVHLVILLPKYHLLEALCLRPFLEVAYPHVILLVLHLLEQAPGSAALLGSNSNNRALTLLHIRSSKSTSDPIHSCSTGKGNNSSRGNSLSALPNKLAIQHSQPPSGDLSSTLWNGKVRGRQQLLPSQPARLPLASPHLVISALSSKYSLSWQMLQQQQR